MTLIVGLAVLQQCTLSTVLAAPQLPLGSQVIDGALHPDMIPDWRAYPIMFRFLSNRSGRELSAIRAYLRQIGLGGEDCPGCSITPTRQEIQIDNLISTAQTFYMRDHELDISLKKTLEENPSFSAEVEFSRLSKQKEELCSQFMVALRTILGPADSEKVRLHVQNMKRKITLVQ
jgi:hypothetical protein